MRTTSPAVGLALTAFLVAGCAQGAPTTNDGSASGADPSAQPTVEPSVTASIFLPPGESTGAVTYDETTVPEGATADVQVRVQDGSTYVQFTGTGLEADRDLGAHVHTDPCGENPDDAGPHYQDEADPEATKDEPSTDPAYANPENEVWLDMTTDSSGNAYITSTVDWEFREGEANSLVLHDEHTSTHEGHAGTAGDRLACVTVEF